MNGNLVEAKSCGELRQWLVENHSTAKECWGVVKRNRLKTH